MIGLGYFAAHHTTVAALKPPHLKAIFPVGGFMDNYREFWWPGGVLQKGFARWLISMVNLDVHTQESALKLELGEQGFREAIKHALEDKDLSAAPEIVEALKNPDLLTNAAYLDIVLHPPTVLTGGIVMLIMESLRCRYTWRCCAPSGPFNHCTN
jgi:predicted acyl esterase